MITIVGQAPSATSDPDRPFVGGLSQRNLERLLSLEDGRLHERARCINLLNRWPGHAGEKGDLFPMAKARRAARVVDLPPGPVLLAGLRVAEAFRVAEPEMFRECEVRGRQALVIPHPSGVSLWWNDPAVVSVGRVIVTKWLQLHNR